MAKDPSANNAALGAGMLCYVIWGIVPLAFQIMGRMGIGAWEILAHRTLWVVPTAFLFVALAAGAALVAWRGTQPVFALGMAMSAAMILAAMASAPAGQSQPPHPAVSRTTISITAMPCNTPK